MGGARVMQVTWPVGFWRSKAGLVAEALPDVFWRGRAIVSVGKQLP